jgi:hypothetical protein
MVELKSLFFFSEKGNTLMVFPKEGNNTFSHSTTTELPAPVASISFPKTHPHTHFPVPGGYKTLIVIPHQTRPFQWTRTIRIGLNSAQRGTLYPLVRFLRPHRHGTRMPNLFSFLTRPYLNGYTGRSQATAMSKQTKHSPPYPPGAPQPS